MSIERTAKRYNISNAMLAIFAFFTSVYFMYWIIRATVSFDTSGVFAWLELLGRVFVSILVQAIPFLLIGVIVSSVMQELISTETIIRIFPKKSGFGFVVAVLAGLLFPVCDCAIVPVASRLIKKGVPLPCAITFMLAAPIVNPIVIASTYYAFPTQPSIMVFRVLFGVVVALSVGVIFSLFPHNNKVIKQSIVKYEFQCTCCGHAEATCVENTPNEGKTLFGTCGNILNHTLEEFFEVGRYLVVGAFISAIFQVFISKDMLSTLSDNKVLALIVMMLAAFIFSVCSTSDAFVAKAFLGQFTMNSIMGFLVLGPMLDIKNLLMLSSSFKKAFVIRLVLAIVLTSFLILFLLQ